MTDSPHYPTGRAFPAVMQKLCVCLLAVIIASPAWALQQAEQDGSDAAGTQSIHSMQVPDSASDGRILIHLPSGLEAWYKPAEDGSGVYVSADSASPSLVALWKSNRWMVGLLIFGFFAQMVFMGRFAIQWIASEIQKKSVIPVSFWWLSLAGATMLMCYFAMRGDPVGMAGQAFGWPIYARNLWLIAKDRKRAGGNEAAVA